MALIPVGSGRYKAIIPPNKNERGAREEARDIGQGGATQDLQAVDGPAGKAVTAKVEKERQGEKTSVW